MGWLGAPGRFLGIQKIVCRKTAFQALFRGWHVFGRGPPMDHAVLSSAIPASDVSDVAVPLVGWSGSAGRTLSSLRPLARALLAVAAEIRAARRDPLDAATGPTVSFGPSTGRHSGRQWAASPERMGSKPANPHVGALAGSPVVDSDFMGRSS